MLLDLMQGLRFLQRLDPTADSRDLIDGYKPGYTFQTFGDKKNTGIARIFNGKFTEHARQLIDLNKKGSGVFVTINETDGKGRKVENIISQRAVWIEDDDGLNIKTPLPPHLVTETSPGKFHRIFLVSGMTREDHKAIQEVMVKHYGSDPNAKDLARVLRVPGFLHQKGEPFMVQLLECLDTEPYDVDEFKKAFRVGEVRQELSAEADFIPISIMDTQLPLPDITLDNCRKYLPDNPDVSYSKWRDVGMAMHHQFDGSDEALVIFDEWSQDKRSYNGFDDVERFWHTFGKRTSGVVTTFKSLVKEFNKEAAKKKSVETQDSAETGLRLIADCSEYMALVDTVAPKLNKLAGRNVVLEKDFASALIARYSELRPGHSLNKNEVTKAMKKKRDRAEIALSLNAPDWAKPWVWVGTDEEFYNLDTGSKLSVTGFRLHFASEMPKGEEGGPMDAARWLLDNDLIPKVMYTMYAPSFDRFFSYEGEAFVNTYSARGRAEVPEVVHNHAAVETFKRHVMNICGGWNKEAQILCNYFACCTEDKPIKVRWAPLLVGKFGDGKSFFFTFMGAAMGSANVKAIPNTTIIASAASGQTGWAEGGVFAFIEELKLHGHNRHDVLNTLKPYLTNTVIPFKKLYAELKNAPNTQNYFASSNYIDSIPIEEGDRRWFIMLSRVDIKGLPVGYFDELFAAAENHAGDIVAWLRTVPWHPDFNPDGHAPMTEVKEAVVRLTADDLTEQVNELILDSDDPLIGGDVVCFAPLFERLMLQSRGAIKADQDFKLSKCLTALDFVKLDRSRIHGVRHRVWVRRNTDGDVMTLEEARAILNARLLNSDHLDLI